MKSNICTKFAEVPDCGVDDPVVLTFDHVRGTKRATVSDMVKQSLGLKTIFDEIAKCEVRCFNCHMIKDSRFRGGKKWSVLTAPETELMFSDALLAGLQYLPSHNAS